MVRNIDLAEQLKNDFLEYSYQVNVDRSFCAIDGLKSCQRLSLYAMYKNKFTHNKPFVKSAKVVGIVIGEYSPHGDTATYDCIVRMTQPFANNQTPCEMHGNGGSLSDPSPAAQRYTEVRLSEFGEELFKDIEISVPYIDNFDSSTKQPVLLPTPVPLLLINGCDGIGVTLATRVLPYNFTEVSETYKNYLINGKIDKVLYPDFPTGGQIVTCEAEQIMSTGKGKTVLRARASIDKKNRQIIFEELCYQTNVSTLYSKLIENVAKGTFSEIKNIQNATGKDGVKLIIEYKRGTEPEALLEKLYKKTDLQKTYTSNHNMLVKKTPRLLSLEQYFELLYKFQDSCIKFRCHNELKSYQQKIEKSNGLIFANENIEPIIKLIRSSNGKAEAKEKLMAGFALNEMQAEAIVSLPLYKINKLDGAELIKNRNDMMESFNAIQQKMNDKELRKQELIEKLEALIKKYPSKRKTSVDNLKA